jgi:hypothetical protein
MSTNIFTTPAAGGTQGTTPASPFTNGAAHDEVAAALDNQPGQVAEEPYITPDLDDPRLLSETLTAKEGDAFAEPPPPPDRIYRVQLKLRGVGKDDWKGDLAKYAGGGERAPWVPETAKDKNGVEVGLFAKTIVDVQIHDPKYPEYEGLFLQVPFKWMDTRPSRNNGPSKIMTLLNLSKQPSGAPWLVIGQNYGPKAMIEVFMKFLAGEPELRCQSMWSWSCQACGEAAKKSGGRYPNSIDGMNKFNQIAGKPGVYNHELRCSVNPAHGFSKARAMASQYFALEGK